MAQEVPVPPSGHTTEGAKAVDDHRVSEEAAAPVWCHPRRRYEALR
jgi:hypothetical protein